MTILILFIIALISFVMALISLWKQSRLVELKKVKKHLSKRRVIYDSSVK